MLDKIEKEIDAIKTILTALQSLDEDVRKNVVEYVLKRLNYDGIPSNPVTPSTSGAASSIFQTATTHESDAVHIKQFKESKQPKTAIEMAVIVAYYLQYLAESEKKKNTIGTADLQTWFRIADFPLPSGDLRYSLQNAKNSGYLDSAGHGEYKLNAIGYNLVKHNLPRGENSVPVRKPKRGPAKKGPVKGAKKSTKK